MKYSVDKKQNYTILTLDVTNLNSLIASDLKSELVIFKTEGVRNLILDLSEVQYIDSSGLSAILVGNRLWSEENSLFILTGIKSDTVKKLIEISKLDHILTIIPTLSESEDYVKMDIIAKDLEEE